MTHVSINNNVSKISKALKAEYDPIYVDVIPEPQTKESDCFRIVPNKIRESGGKAIFGWTIWEHKYFIEAECHTVWEDNEGNLLDITPKQNNSQRILFIEDDNIKYDGKQIPNLRINISKNTLVDDLISTCDYFFFLRNKGKRALVYDLKSILTYEELREIKKISILKEMILALLENDGNRNSLCLCNRGKKFKNCCGKDLEKQFSKT